MRDFLLINVEIPHFTHEPLPNAVLISAITTKLDSAKSHTFSFFINIERY